MIREITEFIRDVSIGVYAPAIPAFVPPWVLGTDLFAGHIPTELQPGIPTPLRCLAVLENAGGAVEGFFPDFVEKAVQIWNRNTSYFIARDDAMAVYNAIHGTAGWNLPVVVGPNWLAMVVDALSAPAPINNPDKEGLFVFSCSYIWRIGQGIC